MSRLWERGVPLNLRVEEFTVGEDHLLDRQLVAYDALGSAAHAIMLAEIGVFGKEDCGRLLRELAAIAAEAREGRFSIDRAQEDGHTAIENRLIERLGDLGRRIHTGRSRNDQVIAAIRLFAREELVGLAGELAAVVERLLALATEHRDVSMPGYSHTRQAMPCTLGFFFAAWADNLLDHAPWLRCAFGHANRSPLGSASGFGVALPLDRVRVAELLRFSSVQRNTLAVQNDRGRTEALILTVAAGPATDLGRLAVDLIAFSREEIGFLTLSEDVTTGSSIMPNKRNPDVLELIRAQAARLRSLGREISVIFSTLPAGYHRDLQLTKGPFLDGLAGSRAVLRVILPVLAGLRVNAQRCRAAMRRSIGATDEVYRRVREGEAFRDAYKAVASDPEKAVRGDPTEAWRSRTHVGAPGDFGSDADRGRLGDLRAWVEQTERKLAEVWDILSPPAKSLAKLADA